MKDNLLIVGHGALGENIFESVAMDYLSKSYNIIFVCRERYRLFFESWEFISKFVWVPESFNYSKEESSEAVCDFVMVQLGDIRINWIWEQTQRISLKLLSRLGCAILQGDWGYVRRMNGHKHIYSQSENRFLRWSQNAELLDTFDQRYRPLAKCVPDNVKKIVLYQGSWDRLRKIPPLTATTLCGELQDLRNDYDVYYIYENTHNMDAGRLEGVKYFENKCDHESALFVLNLFKSGVNLFIGPDAGLTNLAIAFDTPTIWLESRERIERIVPQCYLNEGLVTLFRKREPSCKMDCAAGRHIKEFGTAILPISPIINGWDYKMNEVLDCRKGLQPDCMTYNKQDVADLRHAVSLRLNP